MTSADRGDMGSAAARDLVRELRGFNQETERYVAQMSHLHSMHHTDLAAIALVMDRGGASPKEISDGLNLSPSATSAMVDRLERAGHAHRERVEGDRRSVRVEVTDQALAVGSAMFGLLGRHMRTVLDSYDEDEVAAMADLMRRLKDAARAAADEASSEHMA
ncbi:MarR family winged helix-turn-helix transcriptional regulator [Aeromicrobium wangtongii]|uniref:MarR family transcriptional regulator n=1 Tax=Aeromicrobium wangtongii TaxID=2969247 RepID=A0ABY5M4S9_9ACTN|nr:MarR family transcriptional regulator [Aeromicrobium wangtongii]MCD9198011.1 MarR family transcriptional regulator [Aeromicrobium wangtongii]UUP12054.1 MarR family transcriptional regulator [Aeromicrobium wangtongii]